jgi:hypothetical protein
MRKIKARIRGKGNRRRGIAVAAIAVAIMVAASMPFFFGNNDRGLADENILGGPGDVVITETMSVAEIEAAIQDAIDSTTSPVIVTVTGSKTDATEKLTITFPAGRSVRWEATYAAVVSGTALEINIIFQDAIGGYFGIFENASIDVTSTNNDPAIKLAGAPHAEMILRGTLNVIGDVMFTRGGFPIYIHSSGQMTVTGDMMSADGDCFIVSYGNVIIKGNVTFTGGGICAILTGGDYVDAALLIGVMTITGDISLAGDFCILGIFGGELAVTGNVALRGNSSIIGGVGEMTITGDVKLTGDNCYIAAHSLNDDSGPLKLLDSMLTITGNVTLSGDNCGMIAGHMLTETAVGDNGVWFSEIVINGDLMFTDSNCVLGDPTAFKILEDFSGYSYDDFTFINSDIIVNGNVKVDSGTVLVYGGKMVIEGTIATADPDKQIGFWDKPAGSWTYKAKDAYSDPNIGDGYRGYYEYTDGKSFVYVKDKTTAPSNVTPAPNGPDDNGLFSNPLIIGAVVAAIAGIAAVGYFVIVRKP